MIVKHIRELIHNTDVAQKEFVENAKKQYTQAMQDIADNAQSIGLNFAVIVGHTPYNDGVSTRHVADIYLEKEDFNDYFDEEFDEQIDGLENDLSSEVSDTLIDFLVDYDQYVLVPEYEDGYMIIFKFKDGKFTVFHEEYDSDY